MHGCLLAAVVLLVTGWAVGQSADTLTAKDLPIAAGPYEPTWESLKQYEHPQWFADAKFGIWAHWSAQSQPEQGDWYARLLYRPDVPNDSWEYGLAQAYYASHVKQYGHPSIAGFKDVIHQWNAQKWDPDALLSLYKRAGAKYFVALANHHCNFDNWDSTHQPWNSTKVGPKKDLIAGWAEAAGRHGLRFGVSVHAARAWEWYEPSQGADREGELAGVPYDGKLTKADGGGTWWDGLDPQDLYAQDHAVGEPRGAAYALKFFKRTQELIDRYAPDLVYYDDWQLPMTREVGLALVADQYNRSVARHGGANEAVINTKGLEPEQRAWLTYDIERGKSDRIEPYPWQACSCIGGWHYSRGQYERGYKPASEVLTMLVDIVSKNGNLLLSVPLRGDGTIDEKEQAVLEELAAWMAVSGECIFGTRPWVRFGEGPTREKTGYFTEGTVRYGGRDVRFTTKGDTLYAILMAWPKDGQAVVRSLARVPGGAEVTGVSLVGSDAVLAWEQRGDGLSVRLPAERPCAGPVALRIDGLGLMTQPVIDLGEQAWSPAMSAEGTLVLPAADAKLSGPRAFVESKHPEGNIGGWTDPSESVSWDFTGAAAGRYTASVLHAGPATSLAIETGSGQFVAALPVTGDYATFAVTKVEIELPAGGSQALSIRPSDPATWAAVNLAEVRLERSR